MHEWIHCYRLQLCIWGLWTQLRPTSTSPHHFCLFKHIGLDSPEDPCTYLDTSLLAPGNFSFHFSIENPGCRHKSSFQDCCDKWNALGNFWDWHIHPHLVSRNENSDQGKGRSKDRGLKQEIHSTCSPPDAPKYPDFPLLQNFPCSWAWRENNSGQLYAHTNSFKHNDHWLQNGFTMSKGIILYSSLCPHLGMRLVLHNATLPLFPLRCGVWFTTSSLSLVLWLALNQ